MQDVWCTRGAHTRVSSVCSMRRYCCCRTCCACRPTLTWHAFTLASLTTRQLSRDTHTLLQLSRDTLRQLSTPSSEPYLPSASLGCFPVTWYTEARMSKTWLAALSSRCQRWLVLSSCVSRHSGERPAIGIMPGTIRWGAVPLQIPRNSLSYDNRSLSPVNSGTLIVSEVVTNISRLVHVCDWKYWVI